MKISENVIGIILAIALLVLAGIGIINASKPVKLETSQEKCEKMGGFYSGGGFWQLGDKGNYPSSYYRKCSFPNNQSADLNGDGRIDNTDLSIMMSQWGK